MANILQFKSIAVMEVRDVSVSWSNKDAEEVFTDRTIDKFFVTMCYG